MAILVRDNFQRILKYTYFLINIYMYLNYKLVYLFYLYNYDSHRGGGVFSIDWIVIFENYLILSQSNMFPTALCHQKSEHTLAQASVHPQKPPPLMMDPLHWRGAALIIPHSSGVHTKASLATKHPNISTINFIVSYFYEIWVMRSWHLRARDLDMATFTL